MIDKNRVMDGGDIGAVVGVAAGGVIDVVTGAPGVGTLVGGIIGHQQIKHQKVGARAIVLDSLDGRTRVVSVKG